MKKSIFSYFSYLVLLLLAVGTLSSCDPAETVDAGPSITVNPETADVEVGQSTTFTYQVVSTENKLQEVRIVYPTASGKPDEVFTTFSDKNLYSSTHVFTGQTADAGKSVTFNIEARDTDGNVSRKAITVNVKAAVNPVAFAGFKAVLLSGQDVANKGSFLDINGTSPSVYLLAEAKAKASSIDMAYLQGGAAAAQGGVIGSPKDESVASVYASSTNGVQTWATRNDTRFKETTLSQAQFEALDGAGIIAAYTNGTKPDNTGAVENTSSRVNKLAAGKVFAFKTADAKEGVVYVASIVAGETGSITLDIKVVK